MILEKEMVFYRRFGDKKGNVFLRIEKQLRFITAGIRRTASLFAIVIGHCGFSGASHFAGRNAVVEHYRRRDETEA